MLEYISTKRNENISAKLQMLTINFVPLDYYQYEQAEKAEHNEGDVSQEHPVVNLRVLHT